MNQNQTFWDFIASMQQPGAGHPFADRGGDAPNRGPSGNPMNDLFSWGGPFGPMPHRGRPGPPPPGAPSGPHGPHHHSHPPPPPPPAGPDHPAPSHGPIDPPSRSPTPPTPPESVPGDRNDQWGPPPPFPGEKGPGHHHGPPGRQGPHGRHGSPGPRGGPHGRHHSPGPHGGPHGGSHGGPHGRHGSPGPHGGPRGRHGSRSPHGPRHGSPGPSDRHHGPRGGPGGRGGRCGRGRWGHHNRGFDNGFPGFDPANFDLNQLPAFLSSLLGPDAMNFANNDTRSTTRNAGGDGTFQPAIDVFSTPSVYIVHASLPGAKKSDLDVSWNAASNSLHISGVVQRPREVDEDMLATMAVDERQVGLFERDVRLGDEKIYVDGISAKLEDGVLRVEVPKVTAEEWTEVRKVDIE